MALFTHSRCFAPSAVGVSSDEETEQISRFMSYSACGNKNVSSGDVTKLIISVITEAKSRLDWKNTFIHLLQQFLLFRHITRRFLLTVVYYSMPSTIVFFLFEEKKTTHKIIKVINLTFSNSRYFTLIIYNETIQKEYHL